MAIVIANPEGPKPVFHLFSNSNNDLHSDFMNESSMPGTGCFGCLVGVYKGGGQVSKEMTVIMKRITWFLNFCHSQLSLLIFNNAHVRLLR